MSIWQRWFGKTEEQETIPDERPVGHPAKHQEGQLKAELRHLSQQRQVIEQRGCFSDRELAEKDLELEEFDRRINAVKKQQFRLSTQVKLQL